MRLFIAFDISAEAKGELARMQEGLKSSGANLTLAREFHLTLKFLGEVIDSKVEEIKERLHKIRFEPFEANIEGTGVFPDKDYIRVVWTGIGPHDSISQLQQQVEASLEGMFPKDTKFHPHVTLARVKSINDKNGFLKAMEKARPEKISFSVESFSLIKSTLTPKGPVYEVLEEFKASI